MEEGTIVHVEYDLYNAESGDLIETTREDVAKEHDMHQEGRNYTPLVCVVGAGNLISGFEDSLLEAEADKDISLEIAHADAYGEKDPDQIETISIEGRQGTLSYLAAGRARIDYNHPMAGRSLKYDYKIVKVIEGKEEKVAALLEANTGQEGFEVSFDGDDISIIVPQTMLFDPNAAMQKFRLVTVLRDAVEAGKVSFVEVHEPRVAAEDDVASEEE